MQNANKGAAVTQILKRAVFWCGLSGLAAWLMATTLFGLFRSPREGAELDTRPVLLAMRSLSELNTAEMTWKDVLRQESQREPEGLLSRLPGASGLFGMLTHNEALVVANGSIKAGIDLRSLNDTSVTRIRRPDGVEALRVALPPVVVYPPNVTLNVQDSRSGLFWKDRNIVPKAEEEAAHRFIAAAEKSGIREQARTNAESRLRELLATFGHHDVEFVNAESQAARLP